MSRIEEGNEKEKEESRKTEQRKEEKEQGADLLVGWLGVGIERTSRLKKTAFAPHLPISPHFWFDC